MLDLGKYKGRTVTTNDKNLKNSHVSVIGGSGSGKTVECQRLVCSAVGQGITVIAFDMHGSLAEDQIFWKYRDIFNRYVHEVNFNKSEIPCNLFTPINYQDGTIEEVIDMIDALTDVVADAINAGSVQRAELRKAFQLVYENDDYTRLGFKAVDVALQKAGNKISEGLREKLYCLTAHNIFVYGQEIFKENKINIFRLSRFSLKTQEIVAEMLLSYIWRLANAEQFKSKPIYVFIDECQNMPAGKSNALAQILSEGRKFGVNLILATQMILPGSTSAVQQRITQCGLMLYFCPVANRVNMTARMIDPINENAWASILKSLEVGEFVANGSFMINGKIINGALKISAVESC